MESVRDAVSLREGQFPGARRAFARGLCERSPLVLAAAAALTVTVLFGGQSLALNGGLASVDEGRLLRSPNDDYLHVSVRVQELRKHPPQAPTVYLFGGSGTMEAIVSEASLAAAISRESGERTQVVSLAAHQQSMAMTLALVDNLPAGPGTLAIGLAPIRLTSSPERDARMLSGRPLLVRSPRLAALAPRYYGRTSPSTGQLPGILDFLGSYLKERAASKRIWGSRITYRSHYFPWGARAQLPLGKRRNVLTVLGKDADLYRKYAAYNFAMLEEILKLANERGFDVVLFDQPLNASAAGPDWNGVVPAYHRRARRLAKQYAVPYVHIERKVDLEDDDFADLYHLLAPARPKWQPEMARQLASATRSSKDDGVAGASAACCSRRRHCGRRGRAFSRGACRPCPNLRQQMSAPPVYSQVAGGVSGSPAEAPTSPGLKVRKMPHSPLRPFPGQAARSRSSCCLSACRCLI